MSGEDKSSTLSGQDNSTIGDIKAVGVAKSPFDDSKADLILRSSDNVLFYVHSLLLSLVSPVFSTMFTIPTDSQSQDMYDSRPCVAVSEDSKHLFLLLSYCDPRCTQPSTHLLHLQMILETADKYGMDSIIKRVESILMSSKGVKEAPLKVFAIAVRYRFEELACIAAKETFRFYPLVKLSGQREPALKHISASALINLLQYHLRCVAAAVKTASDCTEWIGPDTHETLGNGCTCKENGGKYKKVDTSTSLVKFWTNYIDSCTLALETSPIGSTVTKPSLLSECYQKFSRGMCSDCKEVGLRLLKDLSGKIEDSIDKEISKVPFSVEY